MTPSEQQLIDELKSISDVQERIDLVAQDFISAQKRFSKIDSWLLGELLGLDWYDTADWSRSFWAFRTEIEGEGFDFPYAENVSLLKGRIPAKRFIFLVSESEKVIAGKSENDLALTASELTILKDAYAEDKASDSDFILAGTKVESSDGEELYFQVCIGDGGEPYDACSPYMLENGEGCDLEDYVEI
ncbi:MAG: hypothetical protein ACFHW5_18475 [Verrucomicrobiota bacterium]